MEFERGLTEGGWGAELEKRHKDEKVGRDVYGHPEVMVIEEEDVPVPES